MIVKIPEDIYSYESKVWGNFTKRQLIFIGIALVIIIPSFVIIFWTTNSIDLAAVIASILAVPVLYCAIADKDGQHFEQIMKYKYQARFVYPQKRKYVMTNLYQEIEENQKEFENYYETLSENSQAEKGERSKKFPITMGQKRKRSK